MSCLPERTSNNVSTLGSGTYLAGLEKLDVVSPNLPAVLVLANMTQSKLVGLANRVELGLTGVCSPGKRVRGQARKKTRIRCLPDVGQVKDP